MNKKVLIVIPVSACTLLLCLMPHVYGDGFLPPIMKLSRNPTICAIEPTTDPQFQGVGSKLLTMTNNAILEWQQKLNMGYGTHPAWNMHFIQVPINQQSSFDLTQCDITVHYKREPDNPDYKYVEAGVTHPDVYSHKANIEIYYLGVNLKWNTSVYQLGNEILYVYTPELYYTGYLASDPQLQNTIDHELGHAFGLAHYSVSNETLYKITQGQQDPPSIMILVVVGYGIANFDISPADITEMKSIYGYNGFTPQQPTVDYSTSPQGPPPTSYEIRTDKSSYLVGEKGTISGYLYTFNGGTTGTVYIFDPGLSIVDQFTVSSQNSNWFSIPLDTSKYPITGKYTASLKVEQGGGTIAQTTFDLIRTGSSIPPWVKNTAKWWSDDTVSDSEFINAMQYLIQKGILKVPNSHSGSVSSQAIPTWVKTNAGWWANGGISDDEFVHGIQYLISVGIIQVWK